MATVTKIYYYIRILSLDVVFGACAGAMFFASLLHSNLESITILCLALSVWIIYTADHLIDAFRAGQRARSPRHVFHYRYRMALTGISLLCAALCLWLVFYLPPFTLKLGILLIAMVALYMLMILLLPFSIAIPKEMAVAVLYVAGIAVPAIGAVQGEFTEVIILILVQYILLALFNLILFSFLEIEDDNEAGYSSFATKYGRSHSQILLKTILAIFLFSVVLAIGLYGPTLKVIIAEATLSIMMFVLYLVYIKRNELLIAEKYRIVGDAVFIIPAAAIFFL